jgi:hypothetical protein
VQNKNLKIKKKKITVMLNHFNTKVRVANPKNHKEAKLFQLENKFISIEATIK